jgi:hypothetical protein
LTTYYVNNAAGANGSDNNNGTSLSSPFLTIQAAANVAKAGDTVDICAGTYREEVVPRNSGTAAAPIIYQPYNNGKVVVSGANIVTGWTQYSSDIYQSSSMNWTMGGQDDQLFVDGQMMNYARWPNSSLDVSHPTLEYAGPNTYQTISSNGTLTGYIYDANMTQPAGYWTGATIHIESGPTWAMEAATITSYTLSTVNGTTYGVIAYTSTSQNYDHGDISQGDPYYITGDPYFTAGQFQNLDAAGEFYRDPNTGLVYLWTPAGDSPASHVVEAKQRLWAFDLSGDSYIDLTGINIFAAGINSSSTSGHLLINGVNAQYVSHFENYTGNWTAILSNGTNVIGGTGIVLNGNYNAIEKSTVAYSAGDGIYLGGNNDTVFDNVIHDVDYTGVDAAGISVQQLGGSILSANDYIGFNTLYNSGRTLINASGMTQGRIDNNRIYGAMIQCSDGGAIYAYCAIGGASEIDHNIISDTVQVVGGAENCGVMIDGTTTGFTVDHNVIYDCQAGIKANIIRGNNYINNSVYNCSYASIFNDLEGGPPSGLFVNNDTDGTFDPVAGMQFSNNSQAPANPGFTDPADDNFHLMAGASQINAGIVEAPYTNGYIGSAPDIGAYLYGAPAWTAGGTGAAAIPVTVRVTGQSSVNVASKATPLVKGINTASFIDNISVIGTAHADAANALPAAHAKNATGKTIAVLRDRRNRRSSPLDLLIYGFSLYGVGQE